MSCKFKKYFIIALAIFPVFISCTPKNFVQVQNQKKIVCTIFPQYDWTKNIVNSHNDVLNVSMLVKNGVDFHNYQPSAQDIVTITTADMLIMTGGESEKWIFDALKNSQNPDMIVINLMKELGSSVKVEEIVEGMQEEHENSENEDSQIIENDEHFWFSIENAKKCSQIITEKLCELDKINSEDYKENLRKYNLKLNAVDASYKSAIQNAALKTIIVADRFPFRYLTDEYKIEYFAAFPGCSAETEASFETVAFLSDKLRETQSKAIFTTENSDKKLARTVIKNAKVSGIDILQLNSMQTVTLAQALKGVSYVSVMTENLDQLKFALGYKTAYKNVSN